MWRSSWAGQPPPREIDSLESLIAQHIASATTTRSATMIAEASAPAATPPPPPVRSAGLATGSNEAPTPPARASAALLAQEDGEGDGDNAERDPPAPTLEATRHLVKRDIRVAPALAALPPAAPLPPAPPMRTADSGPAALGWVKGPDGVALSAEPKSGPPEKAMAAPVTPPPTPARVAETSPAALGWVKGPDGVALSAEPKARPPVKAIAAVALSKEETHVARSEDARPPSRAGWMIQIGATADAGEANDLLIRARAHNRSTLASAKPFTEKVEKGVGTFYRARFAGSIHPPPPNPYARH